MERFTIHTPLGVEAACAAELQALGFTPRPDGDGALRCAGECSDALRLNLWLRTAARVQLHVEEGPAERLRDWIAAVDLRPFLRDGVRFAVELRGGGAQKKALEAAVVAHVRATIPEARQVAEDAEADQRIVMQVRRGSARLLLDTTGEALHRRGYRQEGGAAPLREDLAAGLLSLAGFTGEEALVDPLCGSGTFLIEGALWALRRAPGLPRSFPCESWPALPSTEADELRERARSLQRETAPAPILGSDLKAGALGVARRNAERAGVRSALQLERRDLSDAAPPSGVESGVVIANPPYGRRLGDRRELAPLYEKLGEVLRTRFAGWRAAVLLRDVALVERLGWGEVERLPVTSGGLRLHLVRTKL